MGSSKTASSKTFGVESKFHVKHLSTDHWAQSSCLLCGTCMAGSITVPPDLRHWESHMDQSLYSYPGPTGAKKRWHKCALLAGLAASEDSNWLDILKIEKATRFMHSKLTMECSPSKIVTEPFWNVFPKNSEGKTRRKETFFLQFRDSELPRYLRQFLK